MNTKLETSNLKFETFPALAGTVHGIFTRHGGYSRPPWHTLNFGHLVGDDPAAVDENFRRACAALNTDPARVASPFQVHGNRVWHVTADNISFRQERADGMITREPGILLHMRFADCTPLLFFDPVAGAVGLGHAGWRGTMQNVAGAVVQAMADTFGSRPADIRLVIGPAIGPCCYQVGEDVLHAAHQSFADPESLFDRANGDMKFNLWEANRRQAEAVGVGEIIVSGICTACHTDDFFSHRAERGKTGRFGAFIGLKTGD